MRDTPHKGGETYRLTLRALPSGYPPIGRLKRALKQLLRTFELKAVEVEELTPCPPAAGNGPLPADLLADDFPAGSSAEGL